MYIRERDNSILIPKEVFNEYDMKSIAYFDIETTGFDKDKDIIILISIGYFKDENIFHIDQLFLEELSEEKSLLTKFKNYIEKFGTWCSYNGLAFDEPFIKARMSANKVKYVPPGKHLDLYRMIKPYHKQLGMERCNLKSVEKHLGIAREDKIDGGISVELYYKYAETKSESLRDIILLHNFEDVENLPQIFKLAYEIKCNNEIIREDCITEKQLKYLKFLIQNNKIVIDKDIEKISKRSASKVIDSLLNGNVNANEILAIIEKYD